VIAPQVPAKLVWDSALRGLSGTHGKLDADFDPRLWQSLIDPAQVGQAIQQVVAFAAMLARWPGPNASDGAQLDCRISRADLWRTSVAGRFVMISLVADHVRLRDDDMQHLFHPYADVLGCNAGMRLAMARNLVAPAGRSGWMPNEWLAAALRSISTCRRARSSPLRCIPIGVGMEPRDGLRILVMDDEQLVRVVLQRILEIWAPVVSVSDGGEASEAYEAAMSHGERFDLAILDMKVGSGSGGLDACSRILDFDPLATCVLSSGSVLDDAMLDSQDYGFAGILEKPFDPAALTELIDNVVRGAQRGSNRWHSEQDEDLVPYPS